MPIITSEIKLQLSGGSANTDPTASLGGAASATAATGSTLFDAVAGSEAATGDVEYRCIYVKNTNGSLTALSTQIYLPTNTPSSDTTVDIGLGTSAVSGTEQTVANENTAPTGVTFSAAATQGAALTIGDLAPGATKAVWLRRTVNAGAVAANDSFTVRVICDTNP